LITLNNKLLRILQNKSYKFPVKDLYRNFDTLAIPELHIHQLLMLVHKRVHHKHLLPTAFANYFTINSTVHLYNTRVRENLHLDSVSTNYGKRTVRYKAGKIWNQLHSSLIEFYSAKHFSNKLKKFMQAADRDSIFSVSLWSCLFALYYICLTFCFASCENIYLSMFVCLVCLSVIYCLSVFHANFCI